jgi:DNA-binding NtrC family response regulator
MQASRPEAATLRVALGIPLDKVEKEYILASLQKNGGNKARTAEILGISERVLRYKLRKYGLRA